MDKQSEVSDVIILPHSELMPSNEAQKKARALAKIQEQLLTISKPLLDILHESEYLPDNPLMLDLSAGSFRFSRDTKLIHFMLISVPFFSERIVEISLSYQTENKSLYEDYFRGGWSLSFSMFSEESLHAAFAQFVNQHPEEAGFAKTIYLFNEEGKFAKMIWVHKDFAVQRQLVLDLNIVKVYPSEMTKLDFVYAEQALNVMKERIMEYRQLN